MTIPTNTLAEMRRFTSAFAYLCATCGKFRPALYATLNGLECTACIRGRLPLFGWAAVEAREIDRDLLIAAYGEDA